VLANERGRLSVHERLAYFWESGGIHIQATRVSSVWRMRGSGETVPLVLDLAAVDGTLLALVGGKAGNLGEMIRAGLPVPPGLCVTT
jgi:hypothetical protein